MTPHLVPTSYGGAALAIRPRPLKNNLLIQALRPNRNSDVRMSTRGVGIVGLWVLSNTLKDYLYFSEIKFNLLSSYGPKFKRSGLDSRNMRNSYDHITVSLCLHCTVGTVHQGLVTRRYYWKPEVAQ